MSLETAFQQLREANPVPDPMLLTDGSADFAGLLAESRQRSTEMQTQERIQQETPQQGPSRRPWLIAVAAAAAVILVLALLVVPNLGGSSDVVEEPTPTTAVIPPSIDPGAAAPTQVVNDQTARAIITFAGDARALVDGGAHIVGIQMDIEANTNDPGVSVNLTSTDGVVTTTGITEAGNEFTPTWSWVPAGDKVTVTMVGRGVSIPDTRPTVVVTVQETPTSDPIEYVLTAESGVRPGGSG